MLRSLATYFRALTAFTSMTALVCGSVIVLAGVLGSQLIESEPELIRTTDVIDLERLFGDCFRAKAQASGRWAQPRSAFCGHEWSYVLAIGLFLLAVLVVSLIGMSLAVRST